MLFTDKDFAVAFPGRGRPAISPGALALVSVLQYAEGVSDWQDRGWDLLPQAPDGDTHEGPYASGMAALGG